MWAGGNEGAQWGGDKNNIPIPHIDNLGRVVAENMLKASLQRDIGRAADQPAYLCVVRCTSKQKDECERNHCKYIIKCHCLTHQPKFGFFSATREREEGEEKEKEKEKEKRGKVQKETRLSVSEYQSTPEPPKSALEPLKAKEARER